jgi:GlpG protein
MRLLISSSDQKQAYALSAYLTKEGFENQLESVPNTDWGSQDYGATACKIWIIDEDHFEEAKSIAEEFMADPSNARFYTSEPPHPPKPPYRTPAPENKKKTVNAEPMGRLTSFLLILCSLILFFNELSTPILTKAPADNLPLTPFLMSPLYKEMLFDYPHAYEILDKIINAYGIESMSTPEKLPQEGQLLLQKFHHTPYWTGFYDVFLNAHQQGVPMKIDAPLFEKERQGELWRVFTPTLLHANILHLVFNLLWLAVLGRQMESRLGGFKYATFIIIVGIFSNLAQYLMGGPNFLGISGVLCGMLAYVWVRRRDAAWEGYQLQQGTLGFIAFFILLMFAIQLASFFLQYFYGYPLAPGIANTAHLTGALAGYFLGKMKFFAWKIN